MPFLTVGGIIAAAVAAGLLGGGKHFLESKSQARDIEAQKELFGLQKEAAEEVRAEKREFTNQRTAQLEAKGKKLGRERKTDEAFDFLAQSLLASQGQTDAAQQAAVQQLMAKPNIPPISPGLLGASNILNL